MSISLQAGEGATPEVVQSAWTRPVVALVVLFAAPGCLVPDAPDLDDPQQTRPFVLLAETVPTPGEIQVRSFLQSEDTLTEVITVRVQSNDLGEPLQMALHLNFGAENYARVGETQDPPRAFDEPRDISLNWGVKKSLRGCHRLTAIIAHIGSFNTQPVDGLIRDDPESQQDSEVVNWTYYFLPDEGDSFVSECQP